MALFRSPAEHAQYPPETWNVVHSGSNSKPRRWIVEITPGVELAAYPTRRDAVAATQGGRWVELYRKEARWFAGEPVAGWRPYSCA